MRQADAMRVAGIPSYAFTTTLERLGQPALREAVKQNMVKRLGVYHPVFITGERRDAMYSTSFARFAAELCLTGHPVMYMPASILRTELNRYAQGCNPHPVIQFDGVLAVEGVGREPDYDEFLCDFLVARSAYSPGLVVGLSTTEIDCITPQMAALLDSATRLDVRRVK